MSARAWRRIKAALARPARFPGSARYWEERYAAGGTSGPGSSRRFAGFKANVINDFVAQHGIESVMELGCGDGSQLRLAKYPRYLGLDPSATAVSLCRKAFASDSSKAFKTLHEYGGEQAELVLSLDVVYHLVEDDAFESHMRALFRAATRYVIVYSSNTDDIPGVEETHIRHRAFTRWIEQEAPSWRLVRHVPNPYPYKGNPRTGSWSDFYIYEKR
ncbi:MAG: methyltransferase domain-containing protein [Gemmatimonadales bacterium]|nr:methyltransferase domain-containing protein [Gemmatimonadales bacterium]